MNETIEDIIKIMRRQANTWIEKKVPNFTELADHWLITADRIEAAAKGVEVIGGKYTAQEMRSAAFGFDADPDNCLVAVGPAVRQEDNPATIFRSYDIAAMLRQAADAMELSIKIINGLKLALDEAKAMQCVYSCEHEGKESGNLNNVKVIIERSIKELGEWKEVE